jgi:uncharacterized membrane protein YbhN (UPF0104 family)
VKSKLDRVLYVMLAGVVLYGVVAVVRGTERIGTQLSHYAWSTFVAACALAFGNYVLRFLKWQYYLGKLGIRGVGTVDSFLTFVSGFVLTVTPGKVGEVFKSVVLFETHGIAVERTAPIVIAERLTDLIGIIVLIVVGSSGFEGGFGWAIAGSALVVFFVGVVSSRRASLGLVRACGRLPGPFPRLVPRLEAAYDSLALLVKLRHLLWPTVVSVAAWLLEGISLWVILQGFGEQTSPRLASFFYATSTLAGALVPVPGGLGVTEGALMEQLETLGGVEAGVSTAAMMLVRFATLWFAVLVGFVALAVLKRRYPKLLRGEPAAA